MQPFIDAPSTGSPSASDGGASPPETGQDPAQRAAVDPLAGLEDPHAHSATIICVANQKGGVGKTTTTVSLGAALANEGAQVLIVDLDPQGNATTGLGLRVQEGSPSTYRVLVEGLEVEDAAEPTAVRGLHVLPSSLDLAGAEIELVPAFSRESRLKSALEAVRDLYDVILIDCPPSLGLLTINAFVAADQVLVPIQCEYYALEGLGQLMRTVKLVGDSLNQDLELGGVVLTMFDARTNLSQQVVDEVREFFGDRAYQTIIPRTVRLSEAPSYGQPITVFDSSSRGARAYRRLAREVARRLELELDEEELSPLDRLLGTSAGPGDQEPGSTDDANRALPTDLSPEDVPSGAEEHAGPLTGDVRPDIADAPPTGDRSDAREWDHPDRGTRGGGIPEERSGAPMAEAADAGGPAPATPEDQPAPPIAPDGPGWPGWPGVDEPTHDRGAPPSVGHDASQRDPGVGEERSETPPTAPAGDAPTGAPAPTEPRDRPEPAGGSGPDEHPAPTVSPGGPSWRDPGPPGQEPGAPDDPARTSPPDALEEAPGSHRSGDDGDAAWAAPEPTPEGLTSPYGGSSQVEPRDDDPAPSEPRPPADEHWSAAGMASPAGPPTDERPAPRDDVAAAMGDRSSDDAEDIGGDPVHHGTEEPERADAEHHHGVEPEHAHDPGPPDDDEHDHGPEQDRDDEHGHEHDHDHGHDHDHDHDHDHGHGHGHEQAPGEGWTRPWEEQG